MVFCRDSWPSLARDARRVLHPFRGLGGPLSTVQVAHFISFFLIFANISSSFCPHPVSSLIYIFLQIYVYFSARLLNVHCFCKLFSILQSLLTHQNCEYTHFPQYTFKNILLRKCIAIFGGLQISNDCSIFNLGASLGIIGYVLALRRNLSNSSPARSEVMAERKLVPCNNKISSGSSTRSFRNKSHP